MLEKKKLSKNPINKLVGFFCVILFNIKIISFDWSGFMDTGSTAFILICSAMVCLMTPALAFFYGGLGRRKNVINTMMMSVLPLAIASLLWVVAGYSLSFGGQGYFFGNISHLFLHGVSETTSSRGLAITDLLFSAFQMMFSIICVAILTGS